MAKSKRQLKEQIEDLSNRVAELERIDKQRTENSMQVAKELSELKTALHLSTSAGTSAMKPTSVRSNTEQPVIETHSAQFTKIDKRLKDLHEDVALLKRIEVKRMRFDLRSKAEAKQREIQETTEEAKELLHRSHTESLRVLNTQLADDLLSQKSSTLPFYL